MPDFSSPFSGLKADRMLSEEELIRAIRFSIADEYEAAQIYEQIAESTENENAKKVLLEIVEEELVHVGEFQKLLFELSPEEKTHYNKGQKEAAELIEHEED